MTSSTDSTAQPATAGCRKTFDVATAQRGLCAAGDTSCARLTPCPASRSRGGSTVSAPSMLRPTATSAPTASDLRIPAGSTTSSPAMASARITAANRTVLPPCRAAADAASATLEPSASSRLKRETMSIE